MSSAVGRNHAHLLGIGRLAVLHPCLPAELFVALSSNDATFLRSDPPALSELGDPPCFVPQLACSRESPVICRTGTLAVYSRSFPACGRRNCEHEPVAQLCHEAVCIRQEVDFTVGAVGSIASSSRYRRRSRARRMKGGCGSLRSWRRLALGRII